MPLNLPLIVDIYLYQMCYGFIVKISLKTAM